MKAHCVLHTFISCFKTFKIDFRHPHSINKETEAQYLVRVYTLLPLNKE